MMLGRSIKFKSAVDAATFIVKSKARIYSFPDHEKFTVWAVDEKTTKKWDKIAQKLKAEFLSEWFKDDKKSG